MQIPSREEINVFNSLDEQSACEVFLGKTIAEAETLFVENGMNCCQLLVWMGPKAFNYYVQAAIHYIESESAIDDSDVINCFASTLQSRLEDEKDHLRPVAERIVTAVRYVLDHWDKFGVDADIYCGLHERYSALNKSFEGLCSASGHFG